MTQKTDFLPSSIERPMKLSLQIEEQIRNAIEKRVFIAGDHLPSENQLCEIFKVSRSVVREALFILSAKGLVDIKQGKRATVRAPSINNVVDPFSQLVHYRCGDKGFRNILDIRMLIEPEVAALSAKHRSQKDLTEMRNCLDKMRTAKENIHKISRADIQFHIAIVNSCNNPLMPIVLEPIFHVLSKYHPPVHYDVQAVNLTMNYHERIYKAIESQNSKDAFAAMQMHLKMTGKHNLQLYSEKSN